MITTGFAEIADRVYVLRHPEFQVNVTLVVGDGAALLIDTLSTPGQALELATAARAVTPHPWTLVNTHHHFDHCFGNHTLGANPPSPIYAQETTARLLRDHAEEVRRQAYQEVHATRPELAAELAATTILAPTHSVRREAILDIGGRRVELRHFGRGHTAGDLVVQVPDADVLVTGDLVEEGAPPSFDDAYPVQWPETLAELLRTISPATVVVPGHGAVTDTGYVQSQHADLAALAWLIREGHCDRVPPERVAQQAPFGPAVALTAVRRGYAELSGIA